MTTGRIKVLFLGGHGRSGSTLLDRLLGQLPGYFSVGELRNLWQRCLLENQLCGCGEQFDRCAFWRRVLARSVAETGAIEAGRILALKHSAERGRHIPKMVLPVRGAAYNEALRKYAALVGRVLESVRAESGCEVIVDASKDPSHGFLLSFVPNVDLYTVQLVRDSRAVSFSWMRKKARPEVHWKQEFMTTYAPARTGWHWLSRNLLVHLLAHYSRAYMVLRYEDFVREPHQTLVRIGGFVGTPVGPVDFLDGSSATVDLGHGVAGNPMRHDRGKVIVRPDVEWREKMVRSQRLAVTAMTLPLLAYYGYLRKATSVGAVAKEVRA